MANKTGVYCRLEIKNANHNDIFLKGLDECMGAIQALAGRIGGCQH
jgi:hypothetical protein